MTRKSKKWITLTRQERKILSSYLELKWGNLPKVTKSLRQGSWPPKRGKCWRNFTTTKDNNTAMVLHHMFETFSKKSLFFYIICVSAQCTIFEIKSHFLYNSPNNLIHFPVDTAMIWLQRPLWPKQPPENEVVLTKKKSKLAKCHTGRHQHEGEIEGVEKHQQFFLINLENWENKNRNFRRRIRPKGDRRNPKGEFSQNFVIVNLSLYPLSKKLLVWLWIALFNDSTSSHLLTCWSYWRASQELAIALAS